MMVYTTKDEHWVSIYLVAAALVLVADCDVTGSND
jgi:hypothetical protein